MFFKNWDELNFKEKILHYREELFTSFGLPRNLNAHTVAGLTREQVFLFGELTAYNVILELLEKREG